MLTFVVYNDIKLLTMSKFFIISLALFFLTSCGGEAKKMDHNQVYNILAKQDGMLAGISIGDEWPTISSKLETENKDVFEIESDVSYGSFSIEYGEGTYFKLECLLKDNITTGIEVMVKNPGESESDLLALRDKLANFFNSKYPEHVDHPGTDYPGYGEWTIESSGNTLSMSELDKNKAGNFSFTIGVH